MKSETDTDAIKSNFRLFEIFNQRLWNIQSKKNELKQPIIFVSF